jgi:hypothetical protein
MNTEQFWNVIGLYNTDTIYIQIIFTILLAASVILAYKKKYQTLPEIVLSVINIFIGVIYFIYYGTDPIQSYFAAPLFILVGLLFGWEAIKHKNAKFNGVKGSRLALLVLIMLYPIISILLGNHFPKTTTYIMPCPIISLSIVIYLCYEKHNKLLLALLIIWGLTGVKAFLFNALEDIILLICGFYAIMIFIEDIKTKSFFR